MFADGMPGTYPGRHGRSAWQALVRRLRRWWHEDRIRLSPRDFADDTLRVGDRLQIDYSELRLVCYLGSGPQFEARDRQDRPWTVERREEGFRLTTPDGRALHLSDQVVLVVPVPQAAR